MERRLLHYTAKDLGVTDQTKYNTRIAEANAAQQDALHAAQVSLNQSTGQTPSSGGYIQQAKAAATNPLLAEARTVYSSQPGQQTVYQNPNNGTIGQAVNIPDGQIALNAFNRLDGSGMTPDQAAARLNDPSYKAGIRTAMNGVGSAGVDVRGYTDTSQRQWTPATGMSRADYEQQTTELEKRNTEFIKQQQLQQQQAQSQATRNAAGSSASQQASQNSAKTDQAGTTSTPSPDEARVNAMIQSLPPEYAFLGDAYRAQVAAEGEQKAAAQGNYADAMSTANASHDAYAKIIDQMAADQKQLYDDSKEFIQTSQEQRQKAIAEQQALTKEMLTAQEQSQAREMRRNLDKQLNSLVTAQALGGGFGSSNWNAEVTQAAFDGEQAIQDMHKEFGFKKVDADIQFTEQMNSVYEFYGQKKLDAMKDYRAQLDQISQYRFSNEDTTTQRKDKARADYRTTLAGIAKDHAAELKDLTKTVYTVMNQDRDDKRAQEQLGWNTLEKAIDDYGSNIPKSLLDRIGRMIPGVDLSDVAKVRTLAQMRKSGGGGGGGGYSYSFPASMMSSTGQPPSFEAFVNAKEKEFMSKNSSGGEPLLGMTGNAKDYYKSQTKFDRSAKAMAEYKKEYDAHFTATNYLNPSEIAKRFDRKTMTLTGKQLSTAQNLFQKVMQAGDYEYAAQIADDTGDDVDATSAIKFTNALTSRQDILQMADLIKDFGAQGPLTGKLRNLDPWDDKAVRFKQLITEAVPNLARGTFNEVGVLTDADRDTYTSVIGNPNLTVGQAIQAFEDLKNKIDRNMKAQIDVWDASRKSVGGFKKLYEAKPLNVQDAVNAQTPEGFLGSLPLAQ